jgi:hypothetical protein
MSISSPEIQTKGKNNVGRGIALGLLEVDRQVAVALAVRPAREEKVIVIPADCDAAHIGEPAPQVRRHQPKIKATKRPPGVRKHFKGGEGKTRGHMMARAAAGGRR